MGVLNRKARRGFLLMDTLIALFVVGATVAMLAAAVAIHHRGAIRLADKRQAMRVAEQVLIELRTGGEPDATVAHITPLDDAAPIGCRWVRVQVPYARGEVRLVGLHATAQREWEVRP
jgi:type II secretory pathway pseudopilin PulG